MRQFTELESQRLQVIEQLTHEKDFILGQSAAEKEELCQEIASVQHERDEQLMLAENERQEVSLGTISLPHRCNVLHVDFWFFPCRQIILYFQYKLPSSVTYL